MTELNGSSPADLSVRVIHDFLLALARDDLGAAMDLVDDDIVWTNVSLPELRGRAHVERALRVMAMLIKFHVHFEHVAVDKDGDGVVLTERIDGFSAGRFFWQFWVYGLFEVRDAKIAVWRDSFDWGDVIVGLLRGAVGMVVPQFRRRWPSP